MEQEEIERFERLFAQYSTSRTLTYRDIGELSPHIIELEEIPIVETKSKSELAKLKYELRLKKSQRELEERLRKEHEQRLAAKKVIDDRIELIKACAEEVFPGNWDFAPINVREDFLSYESDFYRLVIHFPTITITNSHKNSHVIKDLYVCKFFDKEAKTSRRNFYGNRATRTYSECVKGYVHSHREPGTGDYHITWGSFCIGTGTPIHLAITDLAENVTETTLKSFLYNLDFYVHWESLEGGPYVKMKNVLDYNPNNNSSWRPDNTNIRIAFNKFIHKYEKIEGLKLLDNKFEPIEIDINNKEFKSQVKEVSELSHLGTIDNQGNWNQFINGPNGIQRTINDWNEHINNTYNNRKIIFKNRIIECKVEPFIAEESPSIDSLVPHPNLISGVAKMLQEKLNNYLTLKADYEYRQCHSNL